MVDPMDLVPGQYYFDAGYFNKELTIPHFNTWIYIGINLIDDENDTFPVKWCFQDPPSFLEHGSFVNIPANIEQRIYIIKEPSMFYRLYDLKGLIEMLDRLKRTGNGKDLPIINED